MRDVFLQVALTTTRSHAIVDPRENIEIPAPTDAAASSVSYGPMASSGK